MKNRSHYLLIAFATIFFLSCGTDKTDTVKTETKKETTVVGMDSSCNDSESVLMDNGYLVINNPWLISPFIIQHGEGKFDYMGGPEADDDMKNNERYWDSISSDAVAMIYRLRIDPGDFSQMCDIVPTSAETFTFSPYSFERAEFRVTPGHYQLFRNKRKEVIKYMLEKDTRLDEHLLCVLMDLNALEFIPRFIKIEAHLRKYVFACRDNKLMLNAKTTSGAEVSCREIVNTYAEVLSAITAMLRNEQYKPLMDSPFEKTYKDSMQLRTQYMNPVPTASTLKPQEKEYIFFDPVYNIPSYASPASHFPITEENSKLIIGWANDFWSKLTEEQKQKAAEHMLPWPVLR